MVLNYRGFYCLGFKMWPLAVSTSDQEMYGRFAKPKYSGRNNEVTVLPRWPSCGAPLYLTVYAQSFFFLHFQGHL